MRKTGKRKVVEEYFLGLLLFNEELEEKFKILLEDINKHMTPPIDKPKYEYKWILNTEI
jgi:hypothetical protein